VALWDTDGEVWVMIDTTDQREDLTTLLQLVSTCDTLKIGILTLRFGETEYRVVSALISPVVER
jgi:hypothetical protein